MPTGQLTGLEGKKEPPPQKVSKAELFSLGEGLAVISKGDFVEMAELLHDNLELETRESVKDDSSASSSSSSSKCKRREQSEDVEGLLSWIECFSSFAVLVEGVHPGSRKNLAAYQTTLIREARRFGYRGWLQYDKLYRWHASKNPSVERWGKLNPALYAISILSRQKGETTTCTHCMGSDQTSFQCALYKREGGNGARRWGGGNARNKNPGGSSKPYYKRPSNQSASKAAHVCYTWNDGKCVRGTSCMFRHCCYRCEGDHKAVDCRGRFVKPERPSRS